MQHKLITQLIMQQGQYDTLLQEIFLLNWNRSNKLPS